MTDPLEQRAIKSTEITQLILELSEATYIEKGNFEGLVNAIGVPPGEIKVDFLQRLLACIKRIPEKVMDNEQKMKVLEAGQEYLDDAINEEEDLLEAMED